MPGDLSTTAAGLVLLLVVALAADRVGSLGVRRDLLVAAVRQDDAGADGHRERGGQCETPRQANPVPPRRGGGLAHLPQEPGERRVLGLPGDHRGGSAELLKLVHHPSF